MTTANSSKKTSFREQLGSFYGEQALVFITSGSSSTPAKVCLAASEGPCSFSFHMAASQARAMAAALIAAAEILCPLPELDSLETVDEFGG